MSRGWPAPAKINLFLAITGRREDGYHDLQTVFQLIGLCDRLRFHSIPGDRVERVGGLPGLPVEDDLAVRAAWLLKRRFGLREGVRIHVEKRIPAGGGLGGGSSDAATVLLALNRLWRLGLSESELAELGLELGSDVPFFVRGRNAWAEGRGEILHPLRLPRRWYLIVDPGQRVSTREAYAASELTRNAPRRTIASFLRGEAVGNAFEAVVRARYPEVAAALEWLRDFGVPGLSGSGGCVFLPLRTRRDALAVARRCPPPWVAYVAPSLSRSPLLWRLSAEERRHWGVAKR
ncbi:MAG: 4-diphosphocytidyl-2-C-methyl-D-erythritol kinase [Lysobacterales bacterium]|nr:MAG: 4-diphosphocytidyl-2-C-methyl-D-erythritol kinase [Xanthomonadales bacterium]